MRSLVSFLGILLITSESLLAQSLLPLPDTIGVDQPLSIGVNKAGHRDLWIHFTNSAESKSIRLANEKDANYVRVAENFLARADTLFISLYQKHDLVQATSIKISPSVDISKFDIHTAKQSLTAGIDKNQIFITARDKNGNRVKSSKVFQLLIKDTENKTHAIPFQISDYFYTYQTEVFNKSGIVNLAIKDKNITLGTDNFTIKPNETQSFSFKTTIKPSSNPEFKNLYIEVVNIMDSFRNLQADGTEVNAIVHLANKTRTVSQSFVYSGSAKIGTQVRNDTQIKKIDISIGNIKKTKVM